MAALDVVGFDGDWMEYPAGDPKWVIDMNYIIGIERSDLDKEYNIIVKAVSGVYVITDEDMVSRDEIFKGIYQKLKGRRR